MHGRAIKDVLPTLFPHRADRSEFQISAERLGELNCSAKLCPPVCVFPLQGYLHKVPDVLAGGEDGRRVGQDQDVDQDREEIVCPWRVSASGILQQTNEDSQTLHDAMELASWRLEVVEQRGEEEGGSVT